MATFHAWVRGFSANYTSNYSFLLMHNLAGSKWWFMWVGSFQLCVSPGLSSWRLASALPNPSCCRHLRSALAEDLSLSLSLPFQTKMEKKKSDGIWEVLSEASLFRFLSVPSPQRQGCSFQMKGGTGRDENDLWLLLFSSARYHILEG